MELWHPQGPGLKESPKTCEEAWIWTETEPLIDMSADSGGIRDTVLIAWRRAWQRIPGLLPGESSRGPAPVDPGNSRWRRGWRGKTYLFINIRSD